MIDPQDSKDLQRLENLVSNLCFELIQTNQAMLNLSQRLRDFDHSDRSSLTYECEQITSRIGRLRMLTLKKQ